MSPVKAMTDVAEVPADQNVPSAQNSYKVYNRIIDWISKERMELSNVTDRINEIVRKSGVKDGMVHLQTLHTTTAVFINEWQDALLHDVKVFFEKVVDREEYYRHNDPEFSDCERQNADAHMRGSLMDRATAPLRYRFPAYKWLTLVTSRCGKPRLCFPLWRRQSVRRSN
jgi:secondary thiamine-phosphate synthase enzyme